MRLMQIGSRFFVLSLAGQHVTHHGGGDQQHDAAGCRSAAGVVGHEASQNASLWDTFSEDKFQWAIKKTAAL